MLRVRVGVLRVRVGVLWSEKRGSRPRSTALRDPGAMASHRCPDLMGASMPDVRGEPSAFRVAMIAWRWLPSLAMTR